VSGPLGFGTAPLGNMFRDIPDEEAEATVDAAWDHGTRFFDTAPMYGAGLAETRLGKYLAQHDRDDYVLSTKVGRLALDEIDTDEHDSEMFKFGLVNRVVYDYTEAGAVKSIEGSLNRLRVDRLDFVFVHDPAQDFHGDGWLAQLETARTGAFRALTRLREEGVIKGWGLGVNLTEPVEFTLGVTEAQPDSILLAGRYTLLDHEHALQRLMPTAAAQGIDIVIGGPYNSGILASGTRYEYQPAPAQISAKVARITDIAHR
jgi:D-threo-aldose 1-dehydrogenase